MRLHHTKNKGDIGVFRAQADLAERGYTVLVPQTEHETFDLVAYSDGLFHRVQVKYRTAKAGTVTVQLRNSWADRHGVHINKLDKSSVDAVCVYCPETQTCYYLDPHAHGTSVMLRLEPTRNSQVQGVLWARDFMEFPPRPLSSVG